MNLAIFQVTTEQEDYARGFVDALNSLRNGENAQQNNEFATAVVSAVSNSTTANNTAPTTTAAILSTVGMSGGSITYTNLGELKPIIIV